MGKESACNAGATEDRSPGGGHGNPLQYACLENPMDRESWRAMVHTVAKSQTGLKRQHTCTHPSSSPSSNQEPGRRGKRS